MALYSTSSYRITDPFGPIYDNYSADLKSIDNSLIKIKTTVKDDLASLEKQYQEEKINPGYEQEPFHQSEYDFIYGGIKTNCEKDLRNLNSRLYNTFDKTMKALLETDISQGKVNKNKHANGNDYTKIENQMKYIQEKLGIDLSGFDSFSGDIKYLKDNRDIETHEFINKEEDSNKLVNEFKIRKNKINDFLTYLFENMYDRMYPQENNTK